MVIRIIAALKATAPFLVFFCIIASLVACSTSGVTGGSLLLISLTCSLFSTSNDVTIDMIATGFIISVIQDAVETTLNSFSDLFFTAAMNMHDRPNVKFDI